MIQVGSLESWLLASTGSLPPVSETPFASASHGEPCPSAISKPVPIPKVTGCRANLESAGFHDMARHQSLLAEFTELQRSVSNKLLSSTEPDSNFLSCESYEGTVRRGRKIRASTAEDEKRLLWRCADDRTAFGEADVPKAQPETKIATAELGVACSLPSEATQASVSLVSLCTALSTPAAGQQSSLAAAKPGNLDVWISPGSSLPALTNIPGVCSASVHTSAFEPSPATSGGPDAPLGAPEAVEGGEAKAEADFCPLPLLNARLSEAAAQLGYFRREYHCPAGAAAPQSSSAAEALLRAACGQCTGLEAREDDMRGALQPKSGTRGAHGAFGATRRGLYEGTVRDGGARNAWRYGCEQLVLVAVSSAAAVC